MPHYLMKYSWVLACAVMALCLDTPAWTANLRTLTLRECYTRALVQSESVAMQDENIAIAETHYREALGAALPHLAVNASELVQDSGGDTSGGAVANTFANRSRPQVALTLTQPLFQGFKEFRALHIAGAEKQKNILLAERARQLLFNDVARAYYSILQLERELAIQQSILTTLQERREELVQRVQLGRSRDSELLSTESDIASLQANIAQNRGLANTARDLLGFLIGAQVVEHLADSVTIPRQPALATYEDTVVLRPDVAAAKSATDVAQGKVDYAKAGLFPSAGLSANYYPYRTGFQKDIKWDVNLSLSVPLYSGGVTRATIKESRMQLSQTQLAEQQTHRQATLEVHQAYHQFIATRAQAAAAQQATSKAKSNYAALTEEYRNSLINNLEVLDSLRQWHAKWVEANRTQVQTKLAYVTLLTAAGQLPITEPAPTGQSRP